MSKFVFVTGGVVSSLGKGITAASLGRLLIERGLKVNVLKLDPYLNVDPGNMDPEQHGEVFVTVDGCETDLDLGHYERFLDINCTKNSSCTSGKIYSSIISKQIAGDYAGATIQVVPHVTSEIKSVMRNAADKDSDVVIIEIGGTVGDMEGLAFLEAIRQITRELGVGNYVHIHCTLVPYLESAGEVKTKPTQHSVKELTSLGLSPDIIVCRTNKGVELNDHNKKKLAMFCNLDSQDCVIHNPDCSSIYEVPLILAHQGLDRLVCTKLGLAGTAMNLTNWRQMVDDMNTDLPTLNIAIVGKYTEVRDSYISVIEAIKHAALKCKHKAKISIISSEDIEVCGAKEMLKGYDGIVVPGGFGAKGTEGKIMTAEYCRVNKVPFLGIGLGMQMAVVEFARNVAQLRDANSTEFAPATPYPVIDVQEEARAMGNTSGFMRLGNYPCTLLEGSLVRRLYGLPEIQERHRNGFEFNNEYRDKFTELGMILSGVNNQDNLVEMIEYSDHPYFVASQFHPEFNSRPYKAHPLFVGFVNGCITISNRPSIY